MGGDKVLCLLNKKIKDYKKKQTDVLGSMQMRFSVAW